MKKLILILSILSVSTISLSAKMDKTPYLCKQYQNIADNYYSKKILDRGWSSKTLRLNYQLFTSKYQNCMIEVSNQNQMKILKQQKEILELLKKQ